MIISKVYGGNAFFGNFRTYDGVSVAEDTNDVKLQLYGGLVLDHALLKQLQILHSIGSVI